MPLQSLYRYYEILRKDTKIGIAEAGYSVENVSFALNISADGDLLDVFPLFEQVQRGKKMNEVPRRINVPAQGKRSVNVSANFLCDNAVYVLGLSDADKKDAAYSRKRFEAFRAHNIALLEQANSDAARAVLAFLTKYDQDALEQHPAIAARRADLLKGGNLIFQFEGEFVHYDPVIRQVWEKHAQEQDAEQMQCLVTGEIAPIERLHARLKGIRGGQPIGTTLVGFNASAYESYNRTQGQNSPISQKAAFAYTTVLNYLLSDANPNRKLFLGDATVVYWAESENRAFESAFISFFDPTYEEDEDAAQQESREKAEAALGKVADRVRRVQPVDLDALLADLGDENPRFYILGLAPNVSRVSVRFFISDPFEKIAQNIMAHYQDLAIVKEWENQPTYITVRHILYETISRKSRDKEASPLLAGAVFRAILTNTPYPAALFYALLNRVRADMDDPEKRISKINYVRAAAIKAYLLRKYRYQSHNPFEEILTMALNEQSTIPAYLLGRLFAVLEQAQKEAIPEAKATIKDRYFTSACASPASVFPILLRLSQHHISKAEYGYAREHQIQNILNRLDVEQNPIPARLTLDEQGVFILGYYHQRAARFAKWTEEKEEGLEEAITEVED
ncbi:MAG: type I-C CRISPR-associated protein Cas8c/Csd1 [Chloroflexota bacterium]